MKKLSYFLLSLVILTGGMLVSCKSTQKVQASGSTLESPFTGSEFQTNSTALRAVSYGSNANFATAKKLSFANAKSQLSSALENVIGQTTKAYLQKKQINSSQYEESLNKVVKTAVSNSLDKARKIGEKTIQSNDNYTNWVALEIPVENLKQQVNAGIIKDNNLKGSFDLEQYMSLLVREAAKKLK